VKNSLLTILLLTVSLPLWSVETGVGIRGSLSGGYPSGKGLWDWTEEKAEGTLFWGGGCGAGLIFQMDLNNRITLETGMTFSYLRGGQKLDAASYTYTQKSLEIPFNFVIPLPFDDRAWKLKAGPVLILLPFDADRLYRESGDSESRSSSPGKRSMAALQAGLDYRTLRTENLDVILSFIFTHPVTSPEYSWEEASSGSVRINRVDLSVTLLHRSGSQEQ